MYLLALRIVVSPPLRRSSFARTYGERKYTQRWNICICMYMRLIHVGSSPSLKRRRKPTTISRETETCLPVFLAILFPFFFFFNSLFLSFRLASERTSEQTMRGYEARTSYRSFCLTEREFSSGGRRKKEKKMNALCSINPL